VFCQLRIELLFKEAKCGMDSLIRTITGSIFKTMTLEVFDQ
jgi:hypothetical protein